MTTKANTLASSAAQTPSPSAVSSAATEMVAELRAATQLFTQNELANMADFNRLLGVASYARVLDTVNRVTLTKALQQLKANKNYKNMCITGPDGELFQPKNFDEVCKAMGLSRSKVDEDIANLAAFGQEMLEAQDKMGIGYRALRELRGGLGSLPEQERENVQAMIRAAAASGDKEEILATLDELGARNSRLSSQLKDAEAEIAAVRKTLTAKGQRLNETEIKLQQATEPASPDEAAKNLENTRLLLRKFLDEICTGIMGQLGQLSRRLEAVSQSDARELEQGREAVLDGSVAAYVDQRISLLCQDIRAHLLEAGVNVDFQAMYEDDGVLDVTALEVSADSEEAE